MLGVTVLAGWTLDIDPMIRIFPGLVGMNPITACCFSMAGLSLFFQAHVPSMSMPYRTAARLLAATVAAIGLLRFLSHVLECPIGVDLLLLSEKAARNRMAPNTALNFMLLGLSLILLDWKTRRLTPAQGMALLVFCVAMTALIGYAIQHPALYRTSKYIGMALHTAIAFCVLSTGILCARPDRGPVALAASDGPGGALARRMLPAVLMGPVILGALRWWGQTRGYYGTQFGLAIMIIGNMLLFGALTALTSWTLDRLENVRLREAAEVVRLKTFLDSVVENLPDMVFVKDAKHLRFVMFNKAGEKLLGLSRNDLIGKSDSDLFPKDQADFFISKDREVLAAGNVLEIPDEPIATKASGQRFLHTKKIPILDAKGMPAFLLGISEDITERKRSQEEFRSTARLLQAVMKSVGEGVVVADENGKFILWNRAAEDLIGLGSSRPLLGADGVRRGGVVVLTDITKRKLEEAELVDMRNRLEQANRELQRLSEQDALTGLPNRRLFQKRLEQEWLRASRDRTPLSLIMMDVDFFKAYNDAHGHPAGDDCLRRLAGALQATVNRPADLVARYGGEEFVALLPGTDGPGALRVAERIRLAVAGMALPHGHSEVAPHVTISLGVAGEVPEPSRTSDTLIALADKTLYRVKSEGRNRAILAS